MYRRTVIISSICALILSLTSCASTAIIKQYNETLSGLFPDESISLPDKYETDDVNGYLPEEICLKTKTQTFNKNYQFCLVDGRIYYKGRNKNRAPYRWELMKKAGLPRCVDGRFPDPDRITEISGDVDTILAFSDKGRMYEYYFEKRTVRRKHVWFSETGWPVKHQLVLNDLTLNNRSWGVGTRRSEILWYEDIFGNRHHYGSMGIETLYFLSEDGRSIRFTDSGLPSDFSRSILLPERGRFTARKLSASGSTIMLINDAGEIYTRLIDFDTMGCDPMFFKYTYVNNKQPYSGTEYKSNFTSWGLPAEDWKKHPEIKLAGKGRITEYITIVQTGRGNFAREMRVGGLSETGETGYYYKDLLDETWKFKKMPLVFCKENFLDPSLERGSLRGEKAELSYSGKLKNFIPGGDPILLSICDFPMSEGECTLNIEYKNEKTQITLYPVEIYSYLLRYDPGFDGTPKSFLVTFSAPSKVYQDLSSGFCTFIKNIFGDKDLLLFSSKAEATENSLHLKIPDTKYGDIDIMLTKEGNSEIRYNVWDNYLLCDLPLIKYYFDPELTIPPGEYSIKNRTALETVLKKNKQYLDMIEQEMKLFKVFRKETTISRWGYGIFDIITSVTLLDQLNFPKIKTITSYGSDIMKTNAATYKNLAKIRGWIYSNVKELLENRIKSYEKILDEFKNNKYSSTLNPFLRETYSEYLALADFPAQMEGTSLYFRSDATLSLVSKIPFFPGFELKTGSGEFPFYIEMENPVSLITEYAASENKEKSMTVPVFFYNPTEKSKIKKVNKLNRTRGYIEWDGDTLKIWQKNPATHKLIFIGSK